MIYITGDTHGDPTRFSAEVLKDGTWTKEDYLIVCGDFGYVFADSPEERDFLNWLEQTKPYTICFCDGNHENFAVLNDPARCKKELWRGGYVHRIRRNVVHLMRGQVFDLGGKTVFSMGGAYSIDRALRRLGTSYWEEEIPSNSEYREAVNNLREVERKVDIIVTHTAPREIIRRMGKYPDVHDMELTGFLEWVMYDVCFGHWYFGHWHRDEDITERVTAVFYDVHRAE